MFEWLRLNQEIIILIYLPFLYFLHLILNDVFTGKRFPYIFKIFLCADRTINHQFCLCFICAHGTHQSRDAKNMVAMPMADKEPGYFRWFYSGDAHLPLR